MTRQLKEREHRLWGAGFQSPESSRCGRSIRRIRFDGGNSGLVCCPDRGTRQSLRGNLLALLCACTLLGWGITPAIAQLDPVQRRVLHTGYAQPLHEHGPLAFYGFYYHDQPGFLRTNLTLRLAIVPVYLDSELGLESGLGPHTDLGVGMTGGGFADSYNEIRQGDYITAESFTGHAAELNASVYHLFNPGDVAPLYGVLRAAAHGSFFTRDSDTADSFTVPENLGELSLRAGLRLGGREPYLTPRLAGEFSAWYQGYGRLNAEPFGYAGDRTVEDHSHQFWARALFAYTTETLQHHFEVSLTAGTLINGDRFSAYRMGSQLPLISEFPLNLPGYHIEEITADQYALLSGTYLLPIEPSRRFYWVTFGSIAVVDYLPGFEQPGNWHSGVGGGILFQSKSRAWQVGLGYSYGFNAIREDGRGAHSFNFILQYDLDAVYREGGKPFWAPAFQPRTWSGLFRGLGFR